MKKKVIISSALVIALCLSLIAGSTFALFTSETGVNVAVNAAKVEVVATVGELRLYSMDVQQTPTFENGGTAEYDATNGTITLTNVTPGDKVEFDITVTNNSNVTIQYRITWEVEGKLYEVLVATAEGVTLTNGTSEWAQWKTTDATTKVIPVSVELPASVGNEYQEQTASIVFHVEAVQGNGAAMYPTEEGYVVDAEGNHYIYTAEGLMSFRNTLTMMATDQLNGKTVNIMADIDATGCTWNTVNASTGTGVADGFVFNGNGCTISNLTINGSGLFTTHPNAGGGEATIFKNINFDNVTVNGGWHTGIIWGQAYGDIVVENVNVTNSTVNGTCNVGALIGRNGDEGHSEIKFVNCSVSNTAVTSTGGGDNCGASAFIGMALKTVSASIDLTFEGGNAVSGNTLTSATGHQGGGIYAIATVGEATWDTPTVVEGFDNYNNQ